MFSTFKYAFLQPQQNIHCILIRDHYIKEDSSCRGDGDEA